MKKLPIFIAAGAFLLGSATYLYAQNDIGKDKDKGKHTGQYKRVRHRNRGLHRGKTVHPVKAVSPRANARATAPKPGPKK